MPAELVGIMDYGWLLRCAVKYAHGASHDPTRQVGALIVSHEGQVIAWGVNRLPRGVAVTDLRTSRQFKPAFIEHAERDAILHAARWGMRLDGTTMVAPWAACAECARAIIGAGITSLVRYPVPESRWSYSIGVGDEMLREAGVEIVEWSSE